MVPPKKVTDRPYSTESFWLAYILAFSLSCLAQDTLSGFSELRRIVLENNEGQLQHCVQYRKCTACSRFCMDGGRL